jgi:hypothetical protein
VTGARSRRRPWSREGAGETGYCPAMARARPPIEQTSDNAFVPGPAGERYDPVAEQDEARRARTARDERLSSAERLERLHRLCAQLATMTPARPR